MKIEQLSVYKVDAYELIELLQKHFKDNTLGKRLLVDQQLWSNYTYDLIHVDGYITDEEAESINYIKNKIPKVETLMNVLVINGSLEPGYYLISIMY